MQQQKQNRNGLPAALLEERRFFPLYGAGKTDTPAGWNNPEHWQYLDEIPADKNFGFAIGGKDSNFLFVDFDHVIQGGRLDDRAREVYTRITTAGGESYLESSLSGSGMHMIVDLGDYADNFEPVGNSSREVILWCDPAEYSSMPREQRDQIPKIELFFRQAGRYAYLTGQHRRLIEVAKDENAAAIFRELLKIREENHVKYGKTPRIETGMTAAPEALKADAETLQKVREALPYISAADYETWVKIGQACRNIGAPFEVWDEWSRYTDMRSGALYPNYSQEETAGKWKTFHGTNWNAGTIIRLAKEQGYNQEGQAGTPATLPEVGTLAEVFGADAVVDVIADQSEVIPEKAWSIEGIATAGECCIIAGASKSGKSYLMTQLSISTAAGLPWLNLFPCKRAPVLYINGENTKDDARRRFHAVFEALGVDPADCEGIQMICSDGQNKTIQALRPVIINEIQRNKYGLVVLDPLYCFYKGSELDEQDAKNFVSCVKNICRETGAVLFVVHHHSKGAAIYRNASSRASGSGMLQRAFSTLLDLSEVAPDDAETLPKGYRGFELSGQPRQAAGFVHNLIFDFPVWRSDAAGLLPRNARRRGQTAAARATNANNRKSEELRRLLPAALEDAFKDHAKVDGHGDYITIGDVAAELAAAGCQTSERSIERKLDDGVSGFRRDQQPGKRRFVRREEYRPASDEILPETF